MIAIVIGALSTVTKGLVPGPGDLEIREQVECKIIRVIINYINHFIWLIIIFGEIVSKVKSLSVLSRKWL